MRREAMLNSRYAVLRACAALAMLALASGCAPHGGPIIVSLRPEVERPARAVVILFCDGLRPDVVAEGCADGSLPNIRKYLLERGARVAHFMTCVPSTTYPALATMLTGVNPDRHGIVGNYWFDRRERRFRNYGALDYYDAINGDVQVPTVYEQLGPRRCASVQSPLTRGVTRNFANWAPSGIMWLFGDFTAVDKLTATSLGDVAAWANACGRWPELLMLYFPGLDTVCHRNRWDSPRARWAVWHFDVQVGRVGAWLEREGLLDRTALVLISDHGHTRVKQPVDLLAAVQQTAGRRVTDVMRQDGDDAGRRRFYDQYDTLVHVTGRQAWIYLAGAGGWGPTPEPNEVAQMLEQAPPGQCLWELPGVGVVAYLGAGGAAVLRNGRGTSRIEERAGRAGAEFRYLPETGDVLGLGGDPGLAAFVAEGFHPDRAWLRAPVGEAVPDIVPQLGPLLRTPHAGQVFVAAAPGCGFTPQVSQHSGLSPEELQATLIIAGPGFPAGGVIECARMEDLTPTVLQVLGQPAPPASMMTGQSLLPP
jgi:arylsulfatase A-like enzyme